MYAVSLLVLAVGLALFARLTSAIYCKLASKPEEELEITTQCTPKNSGEEQG